LDATQHSDLGFKLSVGVPLLVVAAGAWYLSVVAAQNSSAMAMGSSMSNLPIVSMSGLFGSPDAVGVTTFLVVWLVGMVAMMFPAMVPVISLYTGLMTKKEARPHVSRFVGSTLFLTGYLSLYAILGLSLFAVVYVAFQAGSMLPWLSSLSLAGVSAVLFAAGIWQLTPLKERSLSKCISPLGFFLTHAKQGLSGAFRMGAEHGAYCVACCWLYMLVMLAVAAMSVISMVFLSVIIIVEKAFVGSAAWFKWISAGVFFLLGTLVVVFPSFLTLV